MAEEGRWRLNTFRSRSARTRASTSFQRRAQETRPPKEEIGDRSLEDRAVRYAARKDDENDGLLIRSSYAIVKHLTPLANHFIRLARKELPQGPFRTSRLIIEARRPY